MSQDRHAGVPTLKAEIRQKYDTFAPRYDLAEGVLECLGISKLRRRFLQRATGKVLEIAIGTGKNLPYYPQTCRITAVDISQAMVGYARQRAERVGGDVTCLLMDGETLAFRDHSFDTVVDTLTLCTFPDPVAALHEMARVCRQEGRILLLEHGRSHREWLGRWQDRRAGRHAEKLGYRWNREPLELVHQAGLTVMTARRTLLGMFHEIEARPPRHGRR